MAEKEYIEREAAYPIAKKVADAIANGEYHAGVFAYDIMDWIDEIPAADVRPVVLCRDCLHYEMGVCLKIYDDGAANKDAWQERKPDDFCSYGVKREESDV